MRRTWELVRLLASLPWALTADYWGDTENPAYDRERSLRAERAAIRIAGLDR